MSVAGTGVCYVEGHKFLIRENNSVAMKNSSSQKSGLDICMLAAKLRDMLKIPGIF